MRMLNECMLIANLKLKAQTLKLNGMNLEARIWNLELKI